MNCWITHGGPDVADSFCDMASLSHGQCFTAQGSAKNVLVDGPPQWHFSAYQFVMSHHHGTQTHAIRIGKPLHQHHSAAVPPCDFGRLLFCHAGCGLPARITQPIHQSCTLLALSCAELLDTMMEKIDSLAIL